MTDPALSTTREQLIHSLDEAAEIEHNLLCTYLYAAFSLKDETEGLSADEAEQVKNWRRTILHVAIQEMGHLAAVWNITSAVGATPHFGRENFPLAPGSLPAGIVVRLAPLTDRVLQHFIFLERPGLSDEPDGAGFALPRRFQRGASVRRVTPMSFDYATVGEFYTVMEHVIAHMAERLGEGALFCGDPALQLSPNEVGLPGAQVVRCARTALAACDVIIAQGEGARIDSPQSHYAKFLAIRQSYRALLIANPAFAPAHPAAENPVLRSPPTPEGHVRIEDADAAAIVDLANACYQTTIRLFAHAYATPGPCKEKSGAVELAIDLMKVLTLLGESAARRPAGPSNPGCNAGVSFTALRGAAAIPRGEGATRYFAERFGELVEAVAVLDHADARIARAHDQLGALSLRARSFTGSPALASIAAV